MEAVTDSELTRRTQDAAVINLVTDVLYKFVDPRVVFK